jgi:photosystem II stability/assembly factor-like uncharacterized protein
MISLSLQAVRASGDGRRICVVSQRGLLISGDSGSTWDWHDLPLESGGALSLESVPGNENTLVATAHTGLYISRDWGQTWSAAMSGLPAAGVESFTASASLFAASMRTGGLYLSTDFGGTWTRAGGVAADDFFNGVAPSETPGAILAASSSEGLFSISWPEEGHAKKD